MDGLVKHGQMIDQVLHSMLLWMLWAASCVTVISSRSIGSREDTVDVCNHECRSLFFMSSVIKLKHTICYLCTEEVPTYATFVLQAAWLNILSPKSLFVPWFGLRRVQNGLLNCQSIICMLGHSSRPTIQQSRQMALHHHTPAPPPSLNQDLGSW